MVSGKSSGQIPSITIKDASFYQTSTTFILYGLTTFEACFLYRMTFFIHRSQWEPLVSEETLKTFLINSSGHEIQFRRSRLLSDLQVQIVGAARDLHFIQCSSKGATNIKLRIGHDLAIGHDLSSVGSLTIENCIFQEITFSSHAFEPSFMYIRFIDSTFYQYVQVKNSHGLVGYYIENCSFDRTSFQFNGVVCVHMSKNKITSSSEIIVTGISSSGLSWKQFFSLCNFSRCPFIHVENMDFRIEMKTHFSPIVFTRIHTVIIDCIFDIIKSPTSSVELLRIKSPLFHLQVKNMTLNASDLDVDDITLLTMSYKTSEIINLQILCPLELITDLKLLPRIGYKSEEYSCAQMCHVLDGYYWVFSNSSKPMCAPCLFGAKCEHGKIIALPNYWGYRNKTGFVTMIRCPAGYCCEG